MNYSIYYNGNPINLANNTTTSSWTRPSDWLPLSGTGIMTGVTGAFVGLLSVYSGSGNFVALSASPNYMVNWGDGINTGAYYTSNTQAQYNINYDNLSPSSYSSGTNGQEGYRQVLITVTPSGGNNLTSINLQKKHTQSGLASNFTTNWLDIALGGINISSIIIGGATVYLRLLQNVSVFSFTGITNFSSMFVNCYSLQSVPLLNTVNGTNFSSMFVNCYSLQSAPLLNTVNGTNFSSMFQSCPALQSVPLLNTVNGTNFSSMFQGCLSLQSVPLLNTVNGTNFSFMFENCYSLQSVPLLNTVNGTNFSSMFQGCTSLQSAPLLNTVNGTNFSSMFQSCLSLQSVPLLNTVNGTNFSSMFQSCPSLQSVPLLNTVNGTNFSSMFQGCANLQVGALSGTTGTISYGTGCLDYKNLLNIFNYLGTTTSSSITITSNFGTTSLTSSDIAIATGKGWTVIN